MTIADNIEAVKERIARAAERAGRPPMATVVAVTKGVSAARIAEAYAAGLRDFGENRMQEAQGKLQALSGLRPEITWHMVGHVQGNKAKAAVDLFDIIHSIDSTGIGEAIDRRALSPVRVFVEVNVAAEPSKKGFSLAEVPAAIQALGRMARLDIRGLMTVAPAAGGPDAARAVFRKLREQAYAHGLKELSMGMTGDFEVAVEEGATLVRIGRGIFGVSQNETGEST